MDTLFLRLFAGWVCVSDFIERGDGQGMKEVINSLSLSRASILFMYRQTYYVLCMRSVYLPAARRVTFRADPVLWTDGSVALVAHRSILHASQKIQYDVVQGR